MKKDYGFVISIELPSHQNLMHTNSSQQCQYMGDILICLLPSARVSVKLPIAGGDHIVLTQGVSNGFVNSNTLTVAADHMSTDW